MVEKDGHKNKPLLGFSVLAPPPPLPPSLPKSENIPICTCKSHLSKCVICVQEAKRKVLEPCFHSSCYGFMGMQTWKHLEKQVDPRFWGALISCLGRHQVKLQVSLFNFLLPIFVWRNTQFADTVWNHQRRANVSEFSNLMTCICVFWHVFLDFLHCLFT